MKIYKWSIFLSFLLTANFSIKSAQWYKNPGVSYGQYNSDDAQGYDGFNVALPTVVLAPPEEFNPFTQSFGAYNQSQNDGNSSDFTQQPYDEVSLLSEDLMEPDLDLTDIYLERLIAEIERQRQQESLLPASDNTPTETVSPSDNSSSLDKQHESKRSSTRKKYHYTKEITPLDDTTLLNLPSRSIPILLLTSEQLKARQAKESWLKYYRPNPIKFTTPEEYQRAHNEYKEMIEWMEQRRKELGNLSNTRIGSNSSDSESANIPSAAQFAPSPFDTSSESPHPSKKKRSDYNRHNSSSNDQSQPTKSTKRRPSAHPKYPQTILSFTDTDEFTTGAQLSSYGREQPRRSCSSGKCYTEVDLDSSETED